jgi:hypothetical protein
LEITASLFCLHLGLHVNYEKIGKVSGLCSNLNQSGSSEGSRQKFVSSVRIRITYIQEVLEIYKIANCFFVCFFICPICSFKMKRAQSGDLFPIFPGTRMIGGRKNNRRTIKKPQNEIFKFFFPI